MAIWSARFKGLTPRRLFVPLVRYRGDRADRLFEEARAGGSVAVFWAREKGIVGSGWGNHVVPFEGGALPLSMWRDCCHVYRCGPGNVIEEEENWDEERLGTVLDIRFALGDADRAGFYLAWNPDPPGDAPCPFLCVSDEAAKALLPGIPCDLNGKTVLLLHASKIALNPLERGSAVDDTSFSRIMAAIGWDKRWLFRLERSLFFQVDTPDDEASSVLALDFGASATVAAVVPAAHGSLSPGEGRPVRGMRAWPTCTFVVSESKLSERQNAVESFVWDRKDATLDGLFSAVPEHVRAFRTPFAMPDSAATPSMMRLLPRGYAEPVTEGLECAIGFEAQAERDLLRERAEAGGQAGSELRTLMYAPKRFVGCPEDMEPLPSLKNLLGGEHPVVAYLRRFFDQFYFRLVSREASFPGMLEKVCWSYPVTWTKSQRDSFKEFLKSALEQSRMRDLFQRSGGLFEEGLCMDEASAAFLGYVWNRFEGLEGAEVVRAFSPVDLESLTEERSSTATVLVVDCGESTTDVVLLRMETPAGETSQVESRVVRHFAQTGAGLEVTRRIAEVLKDMLRESNPEKIRTLLRTNLLERNIDEEFLEAGQDVTKGAHRRSLLFALEAEAERLKLAHSGVEGQGETEIRWTEVLRDTGLAVPEDDRFSEDLFARIVRDVFSPVAAKIAEWMRELDGRLSVLLFSGRSSSLKGLRELMEQVIPEARRPYRVDMITPEFLDEVTEEPDGAKTVVCYGLLQNYRNFTRSLGSSIRCRPIDEMRRTRAIGVLLQNKENLPEKQFEAEDRHPLLVKADGEIINPEEELPVCFRETNSGSRGVFLGTNFSGRMRRGEEGRDTPQPLYRLDIENGSSLAYRELRVFFQQLSATELVLSRIELDCGDGEDPKEQRLSATKRSGKESSIALDKIRVTLRAFSVYEDFRVTGKVHLLGENAIDADL